MAAKTSWGHLPGLIIVEILSYLTLSDRLNVSATCKRWRNCLFHPLLWQSVSFKVKYGSRRRSKHLADMCGRFVREAKVDFSSIEPTDVRECLRILEMFSTNVNLEKLALRPSSCQVEWSPSQGENQLERWLFWSRSGNQYGCTNCVVCKHNDVTGSRTAVLLSEKWSKWLFSCISSMLTNISKSVWLELHICFKFR